MGSLGSTLQFLGPQLQLATSKEVLFYWDKFATEQVGYLRVGSNPSNWPAVPADLPDTAYFVHRSPASSPTRFEYKALLDVTLGSPQDQINLVQSTVIDPNSGWNGTNFGTNPVTTAVLFKVKETLNRLTIAANDRFLIPWVEENNYLAYLGRYVPAEPADKDAYPLVLWAGNRNIAGISTGYAKIYALNNSSQLSAGFLIAPRHPSNAALDPLASGNGQSTASSRTAQWGVELAFNEGGKIEYPGYLDSVFVEAPVATNELWGEKANFVSRNGVITPWPEGNESVLQ